MHGGDIIAQVLKSRGVRFVFTLCGGHISPILVGAKRLGMRVVDVRHEATSVFAADAVARLTGVPGVAAVTAGPGATNTITAVKNARLAQSPVVLLGGAAATALKGRGSLQDIDQMALFKPHVKWAASARRVRDLGPMVEKAFDTAISGVPGPVFVECPVDLLYDEALVREWYGGKGGGRTLAERAINMYLTRHVNKLFAGAAYDEPAPAPAVIAPAPPEKAIRTAAERLAMASRPVLVVGSQALLDVPHVPMLIDALERLGLPVYLSGMARGLLGPAHPLHIRHKRRLALRDADLVVLAGVPCDFRLDYGRHIRRDACFISANRSSADLRLNRRPTVAAHGDPGLFLRRVAELTDTSVDRAEWLASLRQRDAEREAGIDEQAAAGGSHVNPVALCRAIDAHLPDDSVIVADGGDFVGTASYITRPRGPLRWLDPGPFGTLGVGAGFALGASLARPDAQVWILFGDGSAGYSLAEFDTFVRHGIPVIAVVGNDAGWTQIAREQVKILEDDVGTVLARSRYHDVVAGFGASGLLLDAADRTDAVLTEAQQAASGGRPVLVNAWLDKTDFREGSLSM